MDNINQSLVFRRIKLDDIQEVQKFILEELTNIKKDFFFPPNQRILYESLHPDRGISHGVFVDGSLMGIRLTYIPKLGKDNHGYSLGYDNSELLEVAQFHGTIVRKSNRFNGIGEHLVDINCKEIFKSGYTRILVTVHPENHGSIRMLKANGFIQKIITQKYTGLTRFVFEKLKKNALVNNKSEFITKCA